MKFIILATMLFILGCQSKVLTSEQVTFAEFEKIIKPSSRLFPLKNAKESLLLVSLPGDKYRKLYTLNHSSKKFTLAYDAGDNITGLTRDKAGKTFYISMDGLGDENHRIYEFDLATQKKTETFGTPERKAEIIDSSADGKHLYITSNHKNKKQYRVYQYNTKSKESVELTNGKVSFYGGIVNPANTHMALLRPLSNNEIQIYILDLETKKIRQTLARKKTIYSPAFFHPNGKDLVVHSDQGRDRQACGLVSISGSKTMRWFKAHPNKDISCHYYHKQKISLVGSSYNGRSEVEFFAGFFKNPLEVSFPSKATISNIEFIPESTRSVVRVQSSDTPGDYFIFDIAGNKELTRISDLNQSLIPTSTFAKSYDFFYKSYDGLKIHGIIYAKEQWLKQTVKRPVIVWPHGGPDSFEGHRFRTFFQYWVQKGYVVFAPNFRGSTGYGKKFETLNDKDWGGGHIKDVIEGKNQVAKLPYADENKIFLVGASFGGFSTLSAVTQYPKEFKAAVAMVAIGNLFTFMKSIPPDPAWQGEFLAEMGDPIKDKKLYRARSPHFFAKNISIPLKIYQAENDTRTVKSEMDSFVEELRKHQIPVEYEILEKEGHRISRTENWEKILQGTVEFLRRHE